MDRHLAEGLWMIMRLLLRLLQGQEGYPKDVYDEQVRKVGEWYDMVTDPREAWRRGG